MARLTGRRMDAEMMGVGDSATYYDGQELQDR